MRAMKVEKWRRKAMPGGQDLQILEESLSDLLCLRISRQILQGKGLPPAWYRKIAIEIGPIELVAKLHARQHDAFFVQLVEDGLVEGSGALGIG
jgi:hypothetical protein